ncbi:stalk domain-containing protein [Calidifontibacillus oryziterrae]|uniref:stalk domain-containing protein n=1 Tax=Calidifontibacillus oryziterrae TaxID=1191699 RepID=UPI0002D73191|nr:stalk domain-containing protein [Calidifontibacillus oryziterrae]
MKNYREFISGAIVATVLISGGNVLANTDSLPRITDWVKYTFNGIEKQLPSGYTTLNYEGRTYVPARFLAEELDAEVYWNSTTNTVEIRKNITENPIQEEDTMDELDINPVPDVEINDEEDEDIEDNPDLDYDELPVSKTIDGVRLEVYSVETTNNFTKMYVIVKNTTDIKYQLSQDSAKFESVSEVYEHKNIRGNILYWKDVAWFNDIDEDEEVEGYIMLPKISEDDQQGTFYVEVVENTGINPKVLKYTFDFEW